MELEKSTYDYNKFKNQGTGSYGDFENHRIETFPFGKYEISIRLSPSNEFMGIEEIKVNKDFLSFKQKITISGFHDIEQFYEKE